MALDAAKKFTVLAVIPGGEDLQTLRGILARSTWDLQVALTFRQAQLAFDDLDIGPGIGVVITDPDLPAGYSWRHLAAAASQFTHPPSLIVASRCGDNRLWAEVLNLGGFDLILKPFDAKEVLHSIGMAWRNWRDQALVAPTSQTEEMLQSAKG